MRKSKKTAVREALAIAGGACALAFVLALVTADPADEGALTAPVNAAPSNWLGWSGAWAAATAFEWFGVAGSLVLGVLVFAIVTRPLVREDPPLVTLADDEEGGPQTPPARPAFGPVGILCALAFVLAVGALERVAVGDPLGEPSPTFFSGRLPGGIWGTFLGGILLRNAEGSVAMLIASIGVLCSGLLAVDAVRPLRPAFTAVGLGPLEPEAVELAGTTAPAPATEQAEPTAPPADARISYVPVGGPAAAEETAPTPAEPAPSAADLVEQIVEAQKVPRHATPPAARRPAPEILVGHEPAAPVAIVEPAPAAEPPAPEPAPAVEAPASRPAPIDDASDEDDEQDASDTSAGDEDASADDEPEADPPEPPAKPARRRKKGDLILPPLELLAEPVEPGGADGSERARLEAHGRRIERTLEQFNIKAEIRQIRRGPNITLYALELAGGVRIRAIENLLPNIAVSLQSPGGIRVQAPIPGTSWVGLEVPNEHQDVVRIRELLDSKAFREKTRTIPLCLGRDASGNPLISDLAKMPHLLIAGTTGSGKSVCVGTIILSILATRSPKDVRLILIDPKQVELAPFRKVPHLLSPVVTEMRKAGAVLDWAVAEMEKRYGLLARAGVRQISEYNKLETQKLCSRLGIEPEDLDDENGRNPSHLAWIVVVVDELADLMQVARKEVEVSIQRLAQKSRAVGIHVIVATQRPSVDVITGIIKGNLPARIAFQVASKVDSRTIFDQNGAESLLGEGDMLFLPPGSPQPVRAKGTFVSDAEIEATVSFLAKQARPRFDEELITWESRKQQQAKAKEYGLDGDEEPEVERDEMYEEAVRCVLAAGRGSVSLLQRRLKLGYGRASRLIDLMAEDGLVGSHKGSKARETIMTLEEWEAERGGDGGFGL